MMLDWFKQLSDDNIIAIGLAVLGGLYFFVKHFIAFIRPPKKTDKESPSDQSKQQVSTIHGNGNIVTQTINNGLTQEQLEYLTTVFKETLGDNKQDTNTVNILANLIKDYSADSKNDKQIIAELTEKVRAQAERIKNILDDDNITKEVKALISEGQIIEAEKLVDNPSIEQEGKKLAAKHYEKGRVKELRLKYDQAKESFGIAATLQPLNTTYLNAFASILHDLAEYDKAIGYYELALATMKKVFGDHHPSTQTVQRNLERAIHEQ